MNYIWKLTFGTPENTTPCSLFGGQMDSPALASLPQVEENPLDAEGIVFRRTARGCTLTIPVEESEAFFGTGLQLKSVNQTGLKKHLRVNSDPVADTGDSHAPVPFYVSSRGYGVYVDTARYASFYFASHTTQALSGPSPARKVADNTEELYAASQLSGKRHVLIDIPAATGVELYVFGGPDMLSAVQRYNLFSGGGVLPPLWGLGMWYRSYTRAKAEDVQRQAAMIREDHMPCDVFGLEPGWQTHAYSCTYRWNTEGFPDPQGLLDFFNAAGFRVNLWEHIFVDGDSPLYEPLLPYAGDYRVWNGLVPDYSLPQAAKLYTAYHKAELVDRGVSGFKLDECDGSDFIHTPWTFPEASEFPSGLDGEQMHCLLGTLYMRANQEAFEEGGRRTYGAVRSAGALAAPYPYVLYSDLYDIHDYIRGMVVAGYSGLLWTPEVRQCASEEELIRRLQAVVFSPLAQIDAWMIPNPPWLQYDEGKNHAGVFLEDRERLTGICRRLFELRMSLIPYLYAAFYAYKTTGKPPFRALPLDFPDDVQVRDIEDSYMVGDSLLFVPVFPGQERRKAYLPGDGWYDYFTGEHYAGGQSYEWDTADNRMLLFVREGSLLPIAEPVEFVRPDTVFSLRMVRFGHADAACSLIEDDGESLAYREGALNRIAVEWKEGAEPSVRKEGGYAGQRYAIREFVTID